MEKHPIVLFVGQFGCQLGSHIIDIAISKKFCPFFNFEGHLSFIFVDTEAKVINTCISRPCYSRFIKKENLIIGNGLASGNWLKAFESAKLVCSVLQQIRDEVFKCRREFFLVLVHSGIGATGSGLTCHLLPELRDVYSSTNIISITVLPFSSGESSVQHYNLILLMDMLSRLCDATFWINNDSLLQNCITRNDKRPSLSTMNYRISIAVFTVLSVLSTSQKQRYDIDHRSIAKIQRPWSNASINQQKSSNLLLQKRAHSFQYDQSSRLKFSRHKVDDFVSNKETIIEIQKETAVDPLQYICSGSSSFYIIEFEFLSTPNNEKLTLTNLTKKCGRYTVKSKKLQSAYLFQSNTKESISFNVLISNLCKTFQLGKGKYQVFTEQRPKAMLEDHGLVLLFQTDFMNHFVKYTIERTNLMLENNAFIHYYGKRRKVIKVKFQKAIAQLSSYTDSIK